jgi:hypothetical protein
MHRIGTICLLFVGLLSTGPSRVARAADPVTVFVSPSGDDASPGTADRPLATLEAARDRAREARAAGKAVTVRLRGGDYVRSKGFVLEAADNGTADAPVVYAAAPGETPVIRLARPVPLSKFSADLSGAAEARLDPAARGKVLALDLAGAGVTAAGPYPDLFVGDGGLLSVFFAGRRMPIVRWPADGYTAIEEVLDSGIEPKPHGGVFRYRGDRPRRWANAAAQGGVWVSGFWRVPWVIQTARVAAIDPDARTITLAPPIPMGIGSKYTPLVNGTRKGDGKEPWYVVNLLEELTQPGQWCVDFATKTLYFWPPEDRPAGDAPVYLAESRDPVIDVRASHVRFEGVVVEGGLAAAVQVKGGENVAFAGCTFRNTTGPAVLAEGTAVSIRSCDFVHVGAEAIRITSGDRATLTAGKSEVVNNHIRLTGEVNTATYAIEVAGVGVRVANNLLHDLPFGGLQYRGNDHLFELNEIHNIGLDGGDLGAFYTNGDLAGRGTVIRHNFVHHAPNANGAYSDDGHSGDTISGNVFYKARCGPFIGGGHDHVVEHNLMIDCQIGIHLDDRGLARNYVLENRNTALTRELNRLPVDSPAWRSRYPELTSLLTRPADVPRPTGNRIAGNVIVNAKTPLNFPKPETSRADNQLEPNEVTADGAPALDLTGAALPKLASTPLLEKSPAVAAIPLERAGLFTDAWRRSLPGADANPRDTQRPPRRRFDSETDVAAHSPTGAKPPAATQPAGR